MNRAFRGVLDGFEGDLGPQAMVEFTGHGAALGASSLLLGHGGYSVCTSLKTCSAYTDSGDGQ